MLKKQNANHTRCTRNERKDYNDNKCSFYPILHFYSFFSFAFLDPALPSVFLPVTRHAHSPALTPPKAKKARPNRRANFRRIAITPRLYGTLRRTSCAKGRLRRKTDRLEAHGRVAQAHRIAARHRCAGNALRLEIGDRGRPDLYWTAGHHAPGDHRARKPRALVTAPERTRKARLSRPAPGVRLLPTHSRHDTRVLALPVGANSRHSGGVWGTSQLSPSAHRGQG